MPQSKVQKQKFDEKQQECKLLIEVKGIPKQAASEIIGVSEKTISAWIKFKWQKFDKMSDVRCLARELIVEQQFEQKEVAEIVGVSERTIHTWSNKNKWKQAKEKWQEAGFTATLSFKGFKEHVMLFAPRQAKVICSLVDEYIQSEQPKNNDGHNETK